MEEVVKTLEKPPRFDDAMRDLIFTSCCAPNTTAEELDHFLYLCEQYDLDPLKKEIYFMKKGDKPATIMTSRDGYLKCANNHPQFDGIESDSVYAGDTLTRRDNGSICIEYGESHMAFDKDKLVGAFSNVYRKDRSIAIASFVSFKDYYKPSTSNWANTWSTYPNAMIVKVAESFALKRAFALSGLVTQEEVE